MTLPALDSVKTCPACGRVTSGTMEGRTPTQFCARPPCLAVEGPVDPDVYESTTNLPMPLGEKPEPHMHRTCARCRYEWLEATLLGAEAPK